MVLLLSSLWSQEDSLELKTTKSDSAQEDSFLGEVFFETRSTATKVIAWPFENVIQPTLSAIIYPISPPIRYVFQEDIINRGLAFSSFGEDNNILIYPTLSLGSGAESSIGLSYIHKGIYFEGEDRSKLEIYRTIDDDWFQGASYSKFNFLTEGFTFKVNAQKHHFQNTSTFNPSNVLDTSWLRSDSSVYTNLQLEYPFLDYWGAMIQTGIHWKNYQTPDSYRAQYFNNLNTFPAEIRETLELHNRVVSDLNRRGYWSNYMLYPFQIGLMYNSKENQFASSYGQKITGKFQHVYASDGFGDFESLQLSWEFYKLLGDKPYTLSAEEHRQKKRYLRNFRLNDAFDLFSMKDWRDIYLQQKVLVTYVEYGQSWDVEKGQTAVYDGMHKLGKNSPLRGYTTGRFVDYGKLVWSTEYRWPLIQYMDGVFFNEYGWSFRGPHELDPLGYKNSFGFGIRARKPDFFIMRLNIGFHGPVFASQPIDGVQVRITVRPVH